MTIASQDGQLQIPAYWFNAEGTEPRPVVIGLHGCGGGLDSKGRFAERFIRDAGYFNAERMHFLVLDSFTPRGLKSICGTPGMQRTVRESDRRQDVFAAIDWLVKQANVDASQIVVLGWSHGGQTVLSVADATDGYVKAQKVQPRAYVAYYPGCTESYKKWNYEVHSPLLIMIGELDDWTPAVSCVNLRDRLKSDKASAPVELVVYPGSYHGFDGTGPVIVRDGVANTKSGKATVSGNPEARRASHEQLFEFLSTQLKQPLLLTHAQRLQGR